MSGVATCMVLRCQSDGSATWVPEHAGRRVEFLVCERHKTALDAGAQYNLSFPDRVIYMGNDALARLVDFRSDLTVGDNGAELVLIYRDRGEEREARVFLTPEDHLRLGQFLLDMRFAPPEE